MLLKCSNVKELPPIDLRDEGMVKRVRGVAHSMMVAPQTSSRLVDGARGLVGASHVVKTPDAFPNPLPIISTVMDMAREAREDADAQGNGSRGKRG